ncbi:MAG: cation:dicarboxylase symporter family transporter [Mycoplasmataceae bacterium]|nr:cation:dicarboxylase symporter family transporter [Mycoplasmataceae bacterium]
MDETYGVLQIMGISHWLSLVVFLYFLAVIFILTFLLIKKSEKIIRTSFVLALFGGIGYAFLTAFFQPDPTINPNNPTWIDEAQSWLVLFTYLFLELVLIVIPFFIFFTIIKTLNGTRHSKISYENLIKGFFSIWLMPLIAITVAIAMWPLISLIQEFPTDNSTLNTDDFDSQITTIPGIINSSIPNSINIFTSIDFILSVVFFAIFMGIIIHVIHRKDNKAGEGIIRFATNSQMVISKYIKMVSALIPFVIATRIPLLFNYTTMAETFEGLAIFIGVFLIGWAIVLSIELLITALTMRNRDWKNFFRYIKVYFNASFVRHAAPILLDETIKESKSLGVSDDVAHMTSSMSTSMGQSTCGGFYPAMIALMTASMVLQSKGNTLNDVGIGTIIAFIIILYIVVMITNLGMTGVPGADTAVVLSVLAGIGLPFKYFATVFIIDGIINHIRGIANAFGFVAANNVAERLINTKHRKKDHEGEELFDHHIPMETVFKAENDE